MMADFIWNNRKHRIKLKLLLNTKDEGGLGLPNLQNYFYATQILTIIKRRNSFKEPKWINMERTKVNCSLGTFPFLQKSQWKIYQGKNFYVINTMKSWKNICKLTHIDNDLVLLREMRYDPNLLSNRFDTILHNWADKGLITYLK